ncbi:MAG: DNA translocase FtsK [Phycisphaeraceae bacterium]|nr:DNA translocase FtsK [Phycisphaeraceae bacterium]
MAAAKSDTTTKSRAARKRADEPSGWRITGVVDRLTTVTLLGAWAFVAVSCFTFSAADPPSHTVFPPNETVANLCGIVGAWVAYQLLSVVGPGVWVFLLGSGAMLGIVASGRTVTQPAFRFVGLLIVTVAFSAFTALLAPTSGPFPEGAGGIVAIAAVAELVERFGPFGTGLWLALGAVMGGVALLDHWLWTGPALAISWGWWYAAPVLGWATRSTGGALARGVRAGAAATIRANDLDDDDRVDRRDEFQRRREKKRMKLNLVPKPIDVEADEQGEDEYEDEPVGVEPEPEHNERPEPGRELEVTTRPEAFDPDRLREKIARLPVRFASTTRKEAMAEPDDESIVTAEQEQSLASYLFPTADLLLDPEDNFTEKMESFVRAQAEALENALRTYRIDGEVVGVDSGPVITLYEVRLAPGTKVSALTSVSSDIARALKAVNIRIVANMAGKDTVGVEVPNLKKERVRLKELLRLSRRRGDLDAMKLPMFLGKDASGEPLIEDLASMPHLLIAGTTGSGKSVCINTIILSFLYTRKPSDLKLVLIDPKMVEMAQFRDIPHLMCPVVTEMGKAAAIIEWAVQKMDERYEILAEAGVRDIGSYNKLTWEELKERINPQTERDEARIPRKLPYMVFVIDELADLMMTHKDIEGSIVRIAQKARAVGIHLILATQRPQANVVTGLIKSNMPGRIAFKVASGMDSRIVLDQKGGELLLGQGDMLFLSPKSHKLMRAQGTLVEDNEIRKVVKHLKEVAAPSFERQLVQLRSDGSNEPERDGFIAAQEDPLFDKAVEVVLETKRGSVSLLQRRLAIGYTRASRLIDLMGMAGIIGTYKGTVAREVVITPEEWEAMKRQAELDARHAQPSEQQPRAEDRQGELFIATNGVRAAVASAGVAPEEAEDFDAELEDEDVDEPEDEDDAEVEAEDEYDEDGGLDDESEADDVAEDDYDESEELEYEYYDEDGNPIPEDQLHEYGIGEDEDAEDDAEAEDEAEDEWDEDEEPEVEVRKVNDRTRRESA